MKNIKTVRVGNDKTYVEVKEMMSFYEKKECASGTGGIFAMNKETSKIEVNTKKDFEETMDFYLLKSQIRTIYEDGSIIYDASKDRTNFSNVLNECYGETADNLEKALDKIKELNELGGKTKKEVEAEKND